MPKTIPSWTTEDGKIHTSYIDALKHELFLWLSKAGDNEVGARAICAALNTDSMPQVMSLLADIEKEMKDPAIFEVKRA